MQAIEFEAIAHQHAILIPPSIRVGEGQHVRVLLLVEDENPVPQVAGSDEVFRLLTELSDDFMVEGRQQPPLQIREGL